MEFYILGWGFIIWNYLVMWLSISKFYAMQMIHVTCQALFSQKKQTVLEWCLLLLLLHFNYLTLGPIQQMTN